MTNPEIAQARGGTTLNVAGQDVVVAYHGVEPEYDALRTSAIAIDRSHRGRMRFFGDKAGEARILTSATIRPLADSAAP